MSNDNPFGAMGGQYTTSVSYGAAADAPQAAAAGLIKDTTTAGFSADVIQESRRQPVLVDFWAPWCDEHPAIPGQMGIQSIPAVIAFKDGQPVDGFMGAVPESQINAFLEKIGGKADGQAEIAEALAAAAEASSAGDVQTAADIYRAVLGHEPSSVEAIAGLAGLLFEAGDAEGAEAVLAQAPDTGKDAPALAALRTRMALAAQAESLGNPEEFERRLAANPNDHQARFDLAMIQSARGERMAAADNLLAIVKADRAWRDDAARTQLLQFFEAWGMTDEATLSARRKLSSLLFS